MGTNGRSMQVHGTKWFFKKIGKTCDLERELHDGSGAIDVDGRGLGAAGLVGAAPDSVPEDLVDDETRLTLRPGHALPGTSGLVERVDSQVNVLAGSSPESIEAVQVTWSAASVQKGVAWRCDASVAFGSVDQMETGRNFRPGRILFFLMFHRTFQDGTWRVKLIHSHKLVAQCEAPLVQGRSTTQTLFHDQCIALGQITLFILRPARSGTRWIVDNGLRAESRSGRKSAVLEQHVLAVD